jgi:oxygen-independent coproporphyrinogen-3 oxidase
MNCSSDVGFLVSSSIALYVHLPFCRKRCTYCDFNTYAGLNELVPTYVKALCREIETAGQRWNALDVSTTYLGGGTPSLLPIDLLGDLFDATHRVFHVSADLEITIEANPGTVTPAYLRSLRGLGINRLSLGVQSTHDDELSMLGRIHTWRDTVGTVESARKVGFENVSFDLMFGLPGQTEGRWEETLRTVLDLEPEHLSLYGLTLQEDTLLARQIAGGTLPAPEEARAAAMYELAESILVEEGFFHYEISNWAELRDGWHDEKHFSSTWWPDVPDVKHRPSEAISQCVCRHNLTYWRNQPWLAVGAGAHSWLDGQRWANVIHPEDYVAVWLGDDLSEVENLRAASQDVEEIDESLEIGETMMLGLRLAEGMSNRRFESRFRKSLPHVFGSELEKLREQGLLAWDGSVARLTRRGRLLGNRVFERFI